jgi:hypothetical protein
MLVVGKRSDVDAAKALIRHKWKCKDLKEAKLFVGFQIDRDRKAKSLKIYQTLYSTKLLERFKIDQSNATNLPVPAGTVLKKQDEYHDLTDDTEPLDALEHQVYQQIVGSLIYLSNGTRIDLCYAVGQLARHMSNPLQLHLRYAKQVLRYLKGTVNYGITYACTTRQPHSNTHTLYSDAM